MFASTLPLLLCCFRFFLSFLCLCLVCRLLAQRVIWGKPLRLTPFPFLPGTDDSSEAPSVFLRDFRGAEADSVFSCSPPPSLGWASGFFSLRLSHHTLVGRAGAYTEPNPGTSEPAPRPSEAQGSPSRAGGLDTSSV